MAGPLRALLLLWLAGNALRLTILAVPPVTPLIHADLHLSETQVGMNERNDRGNGENRQPQRVAGEPEQQQRAERTGHRPAMRLFAAARAPPRRSPEG